MAHVRMDPNDRKRQLLEAALVLMELYGPKGCTRVAVAAETGTTDGLVNRYFGTRKGLHAEVIAEAGARKNLKALAQVTAAGYEVTGLPRQTERDMKALALTLA